MKKIATIILMMVLLLSLVGCWNRTAEEDIAAMFSDSVFIGDSITEGFAFNEILPREHVIAGAGTTAGFSYDDVDVLAELKPSSVFLMFGSIDLLMPVDDPQELFRNDLTRLVNKIREILPEAEVYLQSITPVTHEAIKNEPRYQEIDQYNEILVELASILPITFIDLRPLVMENTDLFAEDGIHFKEEFYHLWLKELSESLPQGR